MPTKAAIFAQIGENGLLLPEFINKGLAASNRLKYYLTLLRAAQAHARTPIRPPSDLRREREASGVADNTLDHVVEASATIGGAMLQIPQGESIVQHLFDELRLMLDPLRVAGTVRSDVKRRFDLYQRRLEDLVVRVPPCHGDQLTAAVVSGLTALSNNGHDTVHQLAIDLDWELNQLQASVSTETVDGASVYGVSEADRVYVLAFMKGIKETAHLKFNHPGLHITATAGGDRLSIQNDLGTSDPHVLVIHIRGLTAMLNYADVHRPRVQFLHDLLQPFGVKWTARTTSSGADYDMSVGRYEADTAADLQRYLTFLGSRLVFLIDWNRARKRLVRLVRKSDAIGLLKWAADNNFGHRAFLQAGGLELIDRVLDRAAPPQMRPHARLDEWLGREAARMFLMAVLRTTSTWLGAGRSLSLLEDEIEAELVRHLHACDRHMLHDVIEQAEAISALAEQVERTLTSLKNGDRLADAVETAERARTWSTRADQIAGHSLRWTSQESELRRIVVEAGAAAEALEEAAFMLTLFPTAPDSRALSLLVQVGDLAGAAAREYVRGLTEGRDLSPVSSHPEVDQFLVTIDRLVDLGLRAGKAHRAVVEALFRAPRDCHDFYVITNIARAFERVTTSLARCGAAVRDHVLSAQLVR